MPMNGIIKKIVEAETVDERMAIVEENPDLMDGETTVNAEETETKVLDMQTQIDSLTNDLNDQKQKYRDRFFDGVDNPDDNDENTKPDPEPKTKTLDEILNNKGDEK